jgi:nucleotide-binding universal stress UspA family protein
MYERIVVPLDGSTFAECALPLAERVARRSGAELRLVTVAEPSGPAASELERYLAAVAERIADGEPKAITTAVRTGGVVQGLLDEGAGSGTNLTVMATHGRGGLSRLWLGSVASAFLHETDRPLLLVRPENGDASAPVVHWGFAKLLVPLDGSDLSERVLEHAAQFGGMFDASYHLVRIVNPPVDIGSPYQPTGVNVSPELLEAAVATAEDYLASEAEVLRSHGLEVTTAVRVGGQAGRGILEEVEEAGCDSIAMATHGRVGISRAVLGSAADKVLRGARVPVLLYRPENVSS